jgi:hypothetical protein
MDITNIPQTLIKGLEQKSTEQLQALSRVLDLVVGKTVMAEVTSATPVTQAERNELLKQTAAALTKINAQFPDPSKIPPNVKAEIARLVQQQNLVQMPDLKWINLLVNNRPQLTYSDRPLTPGQTIPVQLQGPQKLVLLDLPASSEPTIDLPDTNASLPTKTPPTSPANLTDTIIKLLADKKTEPSALNELLKAAVAEAAGKFNAPSAAAIKNLLSPQPTPGATPQHNVAASNVDATQIDKELMQKTSPPSIASESNSKTIFSSKALLYGASDFSQNVSSRTETKAPPSPETTAAKNVVGENLRNLLPHKDIPNPLFSAITQLENLPRVNRTQLFTPSVEQALKSLAEKIRLPEQLSNPKNVATILKNSGVFLEHKLGQVAQTNAATPGTISSNALQTTFNQDLKGSLLTLFNRVSQELNPEKQPLTSAQTQQLVQQISRIPFVNPPATLSTFKLQNPSDIAQAINLFVQQLVHKPVKELSNKELRTQLLVLLQQHSVNSLAKIQLQQLHSIAHELETKDSAATSASWQVEIPVKYNNEVQQLHVRIDRDWIDEQKESATEQKKSSDKIKQWSVTLRFDLPTLGGFCAQLAIVNKQVSATLWAAQEKTFTQVRNQIENLRKQLESEGIKVKQLQCMRGVPPEKPISLSYSLIDVST